MFEIGNVQFYREELRDLAVAWVALSVAFTLFLEGDFLRGRTPQPPDVSALATLFVLSVLTVGTGFLLHEIAHKVVAVKFGQLAAFRADYSMLAITIVSGIAGFLFAAPGAVHHRGRITVRQNGIIAVAGPVTNLVLAVLFFVPFLVGPGFVGRIGFMGVSINLVLAVFNMIPYGPLDGKSVWTWHKGVFAAVIGTGILWGIGFLLFFLS